MASSASTNALRNDEQAVSTDMTGPVKLYWWDTRAAIALLMLFMIVRGWMLSWP